jgi:hypothetical protein
VCKSAYKFVKNESYQIFANICKSKFAYIHILQVPFKNLPKMIVKKLVLPKYIDYKLQIYDNQY